MKKPAFLGTILAVAALMPQCGRSPNTEGVKPGVGAVVPGNKPIDLKMEEFLNIQLVYDAGISPTGGLYRTSPSGEYTIFFNDHSRREAPIGTQLKVDGVPVGDCADEINAVRAALAQKMAKDAGFPIGR